MNSLSVTSFVTSRILAFSFDIQYKYNNSTKHLNFVSIIILLIRCLGCIKMPCTHSPDCDKVPESKRTLFKSKTRGGNDSASDGTGSHHSSRSGGRRGCNWKLCMKIIIGVLLFLLLLYIIGFVCVLLIDNITIRDIKELSKEVIFHILT